MAKRKGQTLVEVVVATMVAAMTATAVFSVVLSSQVGGVRSDKREAASMAVKAAQEQLRVFVTAVPNEAGFSPNAGGHWAGDSNAGWALQSGNHNVSFLLDKMPQLKGGPADALPTLTYRVQNQNCGFGLNTENTSCKQVTFTITFPQ